MTNRQETISHAASLFYRIAHDAITGKAAPVDLARHVENRLDALNVAIDNGSADYAAGWNWSRLRAEMTSACRREAHKAISDVRAAARKEAQAETMLQSPVVKLTKISDHRDRKTYAAEGSPVIVVADRYRTTVGGRRVYLWKWKAFDTSKLNHEAPACEWVCGKPPFVVVVRGVRRMSSMRRALADSGCGATI